MAEAATLRQLGSSLPAERTHFVGRRQDRADLRRLLSRSRLVTLTGFGGVGKTRLALRLAGELSRVYSDGVWFVPFAELADPALVPDAVAAALGIEDNSGLLDESRLAGVLRHRELLLVFDNCEHLIDACATLAESLLQGCPRVRILATSREPLRVQGEALRSVLPLSIPSAEDGVVGEPEDYEAVQLLVERASQVAPDFVVTRENSAAVIEICRLLDGIPLALELAAVRLRAMSPSDLLRGLRRHWQLLDVGIRAAPDRHQTMTACLDWSFALCEQEEQELWARLSVFVGGIELDSIEYMAAADAPAALPADRVVLTVQSLVEKSILVAEPSQQGMRFRMLEIIRLFGIARLDESGWLHPMRRRHRDWHAEMLARFDEGWVNAEHVARMRRVRREDANLRAAMRFCWQEPGEAATGLELAGRLWKYSMAYGWFSETRLRLHRLLPKVPEPSTVRLSGLHAACWLAVLQGDREAAAALLREASGLAAQLTEPARSRVERLAGWHELFLGDLRASVEHLQRAVHGFGAAGWTVEQAESLVLLGMGHGFAGELTKAAQAHAECLRMCADGAHPWARSYALQWGGLVAWEQGDHEQALAWVKQSLELKRQIQERLGVALGLESMAWIEAGAAPRRATTMLGAAAALWRSMGSSPDVLPGLSSYHEGSEVKLRGALGEKGFLAAFEYGASMSADDATTFALEETTAEPPASEDTHNAIDSVNLTPREREIARLVADGLSNKEIANNLVISTRTAEAHVEHILVKLGFTSRTQIAAWVSRHSGPGGGRQWVRVRPQIALPKNRPAAAMRGSSTARPIPMAMSRPSIRLGCGSQEARGSSWASRWRPIEEVGLRGSPPTPEAFRCEPPTSPDQADGGGTRSSPLRS